MSRCFPYPPPPPYFEEGLIESIKLRKEREKAKKEKRKQKKREKKEKREKAGHENSQHTVHTHKKRKYEEWNQLDQKDGSKAKATADAVEQLEKSALTEEHEQSSSIRNAYGNIHKKRKYEEWSQLGQKDGSRAKAAADAVEQLEKSALTEEHEKPSSIRNAYDNIHKKRKYEEWSQLGQKDGSKAKATADAVEQLEKSALTEEHGQPSSILNAYESSESSQDSSKRRKLVATGTSQDNHGSLLRIRLPLVKQKDPTPTSMPVVKQRCPAPRARIPIVKQKKQLPPARLPIVKQTEQTPSVSLPIVKQKGLEPPAAMPTVKQKDLKPPATRPAVKQKDLKPRATMPTLNQTNLGLPRSSEETCSSGRIVEPDLKLEAAKTPYIKPISKRNRRMSEMERRFTDPTPTSVPLVKQRGPAPPVRMPIVKQKKQSPPARLSIVKQTEQTPSVSFPIVKQKGLEPPAAMPTVKQKDLKPPATRPAVKQKDLKPRATMPTLNQTNLGLSRSGEETCSSGRIAEPDLKLEAAKTPYIKPISKRNRRMSEMERRFTDLVNWSFPPLQLEHSDTDNQDWLFGSSSKRHSSLDANRCQVSADGLLSHGSSVPSLQLQACYMSEFDMYQLPYAIPY